MKKAIVTGGTRGIGLATVELLLQNGYSVTALYSQDEESAKRARERFPSATFLRADVGKEEDVKRVFEGFSSLDLLVNNAGVELYKLAQDTSFDEWRRVMEINAGGPFLCSKYAVKKMLDSGGAIVNVASIWGQTGASMESVYSASKGAVIAFTKALAKELAPMQITVNCVCPGATETEMLARFDREEQQAIKEEIPLSRFAFSEEIAGAILFLGENRYITGEILSINGGLYI